MAYCGRCRAQFAGGVVTTSGRSRCVWSRLGYGGGIVAAHVLMVDDDPAHARMHVFLLASEGYTVTAVADPPAAFATLRARACDLVLFVPRPPDLGIAVAGLKRAYPAVPLIVLHTPDARHRSEDAVAALQSGADAYIPAPCDPAVLRLRIAAVLRGFRCSAEPEDTVVVGDAALDRTRLTFTGASGTPVHLTPMEARIMACLMHTPRVVVSREHLIAHAWGGAAARGYNRVDVFVHRLRRKIAAHPQDRDLIATVRGIGYRFGVPAPSRGGAHVSWGTP